MEILLPPNELDALTSGGARAFADDILRGWRVKSVFACMEQDAAAKVWQDLRPLHHPVLGQLDMVVMPGAWKMQRQLHGEGCWRDPDFRAWFKRCSPDCRIQSRSAHVRVAVDGWRDRHLPILNSRPRDPDADRLISANACTPSRSGGGGVN